MSNRKISTAGLALIKSFEGCRLTAYKPVPTETYWTIGWGHYGPDVTQGMTITQAQADAMFLNDLVRYEKPVNDLSLQLNQNQFDALVSFCYNCGAGNLRKLCLGRTIEQIAASLPDYNKSSGTVLAGLVRRRAAELALFNKDEEAMKPEDKAAFEALQATVKQQGETIKVQEQQLAELKSKAGQVPAPAWFVKEFANDGVLAKISDPQKPLVFWETLAVSLRLQGLGNGRKK